MDTNTEKYECYWCPKDKKVCYFLGWYPLPNGTPVKETEKFMYYPDPDGRKKYRKK